MRAAVVVLLCLQHVLIKESTARRQGRAKMGKIRPMDKVPLEVYRKGAPARCTIHKWHTKFTSDDYFIENEVRPGRSMQLDLEVLRSQGEAGPYQTTRELAVTLGESVHDYSWFEVNRLGAKVLSIGALYLEAV
nr:hypothetical protein HCOI_00888000 [Haemonchus contortus]